MLLKGHEVVTFPIALLGLLWYMFIQTPFHQGQTKAFNKLMITAAKADQENDRED